MKQLIAGKTGALQASPTKAVQELMQKRANDGSVERPDVAPPEAETPEVRVKVYAPKTAAFLQKGKR